jgi:hypothetical protein
MSLPAANSAKPSFSSLSAAFTSSRCSVRIWMLTLIGPSMSTDRSALSTRSCVLLVRNRQCLGNAGMMVMHPDITNVFPTKSVSRSCHSRKSGIGISSLRAQLEDQAILCCENLPQVIEQAQHTHTLCRRWAVDADVRFQKDAMVSSGPRPVELLESMVIFQ